MRIAEQQREAARKKEEERQRIASQKKAEQQRLADERKRKLELDAVQRAEEFRLQEIRREDLARAKAEEQKQAIARKQQEAQRLAEEKKAAEAKQIKDERQPSALKTAPQQLTSISNTASPVSKVALALPSGTESAGLPVWKGFAIEHPESLGANSGLGHGYCTDYVKKVYADSGMPLPFTDDAGKWFAQAQHNPHYSVLENADISKAPPGAIAVWDNGGYGHVAIVKTNDGVNSITFAEVNWGKVDTSLPKDTYTYMKKEAITSSFNKVELHQKSYSDAIARSGGEYKLLGFIIPQ